MANDTAPSVSEIVHVLTGNGAGRLVSMALLCFLVATVLALVAATGGHFITDNPAAWSIAFIAAGLAFTCLPINAMWSWPRRGP